MLHVSLDDWIMQDGVYTPFSVGDVAWFAIEIGPRVEFGSSKEVNDVETVYSLNGVVFARFDDVWVFDCGLKLYSKSRLPLGTTVGDPIQVTGVVGIDHYSYKEEYCNRIEFPPLLYHWKIVEIRRTSLHYSKAEADAPQGQSIKKIDHTKDHYEIVESTLVNCGSQDVHFVLDCELLDPRPRSKF